MTVQSIVNDRVKVFQAASVESIEDIPVCPHLLKSGVHLITVLQLEQEVWPCRRALWIFGQFAKIGILVEIEETNCEQEKSKYKKECGSCCVVAMYLIFLQRLYSKTF